MPPIKLVQRFKAADPAPRTRPNSSLVGNLRRILQKRQHPVPSSPIRPALEKAGRRLHHPNLLRHSNRNPLIQRNTVFLSQPPRRILSRIGKSERISMRAGCFSNPLRTITSNCGRM